MAKSPTKSKATKKGGIGTTFSSAARAVPPGGPGTSIKPAAKASALGGVPTTFVIRKRHLAEGGPGTAVKVRPPKPVSKISIHKDAQGNIHLGLSDK